MDGESERDCPFLQIFFENKEIGILRFVRLSIYLLITIRTEIRNTIEQRLL